MTEELKQKAEEYTNTHGTMVMGCEENLDATELMQQAYIAGATENCIEWHKVTDWKNTEQFPQEESFPYFVVTKKDGYYLCEWEIDEGCGQFYSMYEGVDIDPENVVLWAKIEIPQFKE